MLKPVLDYDKRASYVLLRAATNSGADSGPYQEQVCEIDPEDCIGAGEYFAARGENSRAIKAFERALSKVGDSVLVANNMDWPVDYYLDNGREDDAFRIAKFAADVYSYRGLRTMGRLMERLGRYDDAVSWYQRIQERYDDSSVLEQLYVRYRQRVGGDRFAKESATALNKMFPNGLEKAAYSDFTNSPTSGDGCKITEKDMTQKLRETGLRTGDLIVAADGYRVHNAEQWTTIRSFSDDPAISLIVWRGGGYLQLNGKYIRMKYGPPGKGHLPELL
jgi:tetratricopeptide (TPR) repeat protein